MTEFKQQDSRFFNDKKPTAIPVESRIKGNNEPAHSLTFYSMDDAEVRKLTLSILDERSEALEYLASR